MKKIIILGSTGSIGTQTLDIVDENPDLFTVTALSCRSRVDELIQQIENLVISSRNALHHLLSTEDDFLDGQGLVFVLFSHVFLLS